MNYIQVKCPAGHQLQARPHLRGRTLPCPKCQADVEIPVSHDPLSDTGVMRILGDLSALPDPPKSQQPVTSRRCPRCELEVHPNATVCRHCSCYIGSVPDYMQKLG